MVNVLGGDYGPMSDDLFGGYPHCSPATRG